MQQDMQCREMILMRRAHEKLLLGREDMASGNKSDYEQFLAGLSRQSTAS